VAQQSRIDRGLIKVNKKIANDHKKPHLSQFKRFFVLTVLNG
jgi:hypothetical protein